MRTTPTPQPFGRRSAATAGRQSGSALLITMVISGIIGITLFSYLGLVNQQNRSIFRSQMWNYGIPIAEAGLEEALVQVFYNAENLGANGWTLVDGSYRKQRVLGDGYYLAMISNVNPPVIYSQGYVKIPNSTNYLQPRTLRVTTAANALFRKGMVAKGNINLSGNNIVTDSFDSADPAFSTGGKYDPAKRRDNGDVATNSRIVNWFNIGNANIFGHVSTGPGGNVNVGVNGAVGSKAWQDAGNKGIEPGWYTDDMNASFPDVPEPFTGGISPSGGNVGGTNYSYVLVTGNYKISDLELSGNQKMLVAGNAKLYVTDELDLGGQSFIYIATNASLQLYMGGSSASLGGHGVANVNASATNFYYYGLPSNTSMSLSGNASFTGVIYAPSASFTLGGGGSDPYDFVGASVTGSVRLNGKYSFHYDEFLARAGGSAGFTIMEWNEL